MENTTLFAINSKTEEIMVSSTAEGSNSIKLIDRIPRNENELLFQAVQTMSVASRSPHIDEKIFNSIDHLCQLIYQKQHSSK
jgi:hypothetical protein